MLEPLLQLVSTSRCVIAPDLPGFGGSPALAGDCSPAALAVVVALLDRLGIGAADLHGVGEGGLVALEAALAGPARFRSLALEDVPLLAPYQAEELVARYAPPLGPRGRSARRLESDPRRVALLAVLHADPPGHRVDGRADAYRAAFTYPQGERLRALTVRARRRAPGLPCRPLALRTLCYARAEPRSSVKETT